MMKISKTICARFVAFTLLVLTLVACDEETTTPEVDGAALFGVWTATSAVVMNCDDPDENGSFAQACTSTDCLKVEFKADGTFISTELDGGVTITENGTFEVSGDQMTIRQGSDVEVATFEITDDVLKLSGNEPDLGCDFTTTFTKDS